MFQIEIILKLQEFCCEWAVLAMKAVSAMGSVPFFACVILVVMLGVDYGKGFYLLRLLLCASLGSDLLKLAFALPRPFIADSRIVNFEGWSSPSPLSDAGGSRFLDLPKSQSIELFRSAYSPHFGFPSSHLSGFTSLALGIQRSFRNKPLLIALPVLTAILALSRMCLGVHFLADVLGGIVVGLVFFGVFAAIGKISGVRASDGNPSATRHRARLMIAASAAMILASTVAGLAISGDHCRQAGCLAGANAAYLLIDPGKADWSRDSLMKRSARVLLGISLFCLVNFILGFALGRTLGYSCPYQADFLEYSASSFAAVFVACKRAVFKVKTKTR
jgi:membrane-associated phospholipid phosphatase